LPYSTCRGRLAAGRDVAIAGFDKFSVAERAGRKGRKPATGERIQIARQPWRELSAAAGLKQQLKG
jgi:DNA-binding protein HU-beta